MAVIRKANEITADVTGHKQVQFRMAIVQRKAPGAYGFEFGQGKLAVDALAAYLLNGATMPKEMATRIDALGEKLRDHSFNRRIFENLFPNMQQQLQKNQIVSTVAELQDAVAKAMGKTADPALIAIYTELLIEVFSSASFVVPTRGYMHREVRLNKFPTFIDLVREAMRSELVAVMKEAPLRIALDSSRFTPAYIHSQFQETFSSLGGAMARVGYQYYALQDAAYLVVSALMAKGSQVDAVPEEVLHSAGFAELLTNFTFVKAALEAKIQSASSPAWELPKSVAKVLSMLNLSERYEMVPLDVAVAHYQYESVFDGRSNLIGGVLSYKTNFKQPIKVGLVEAVGNIPGVLQMTQLPIYEQTIASAIAPLNGWDPMSAAHRAAVTMMSTLTVSELDDTPRSVLFCPDVLAQGDLIHVAVAKADAVFIPQPNKRNMHLVADRLLFMKDLAGKRLFAEEIPFEGVIYTPDPATLILGCQSWEAKTSFDLADQEIPAHLWENFIVGATDDALIDYGQERSISVEIGGTPVELKLDLNSMLYLLPRTRARMVQNPISMDVMSAAISSLFAVHTMVIERLDATKQGNHAIEIVNNQIAMLMNGFLEKLYRSNVGEQIVSDTIRRLAKGVSRENRELTYSRLQQAHYRVQVAVQVAVALMEATGILNNNNYAVVDEEQVSLGDSVLNYLKENRFYSRMVGAILD